MADETTPTPEKTAQADEHITPDKQLEADSLKADEQAKAEEQAKADEQSALDAKFAEEAESKRVRAQQESARKEEIDMAKERARLAVAPPSGSVFKVKAGVGFTIDGPGGNISPIE
jgi:hypothetical protein